MHDSTMILTRRGKWMPVSQLRAISYAVSERERKLNAIEEMGMMEDYKEFCKGYKHHRIASFCKEKGIRL